MPQNAKFGRQFQGPYARMMTFVASALAKRQHFGSFLASAFHRRYRASKYDA